MALANLDILEREGLVDRVKELEQQLVEGMQDLASRRPSVTEVRVCGLLAGATLDDGFDAVAVTDALIDRGFIARPLRGNTLQLSPPFITTDNELATLVDAIDDTLIEQEKK